MVSTDFQSCVHDVTNGEQASVVSMLLNSQASKGELHFCELMLSIVRSVEARVEDDEIEVVSGQQHTSIRGG